MVDAAVVAFSSPSTWPLGAAVFAFCWAGLVGAALASFMGVVADRTLTDESLGGRSHCTCGRTLRPAELFPVAGGVWVWLARRGRVRCCGGRLPLRYWMTEVLEACLFGTAALEYGISWRTLALWLVGVTAAAAILFTLALRDQHGRPPVDPGHHSG